MHAQRLSFYGYYEEQFCFLKVTPASNVGLKVSSPGPGAVHSGQSHPGALRECTPDSPGHRPHSNPSYTYFLQNHYPRYPLLTLFIILILHYQNPLLFCIIYVYVHFFLLSNIFSKAVCYLFFSLQNITSGQSYLGN